MLFADPTTTPTDSPLQNFHPGASAWHYMDLFVLGIILLLGGGAVVVSAIKGYGGDATAWMLGGGAVAALLGLWSIIQGINRANKGLHHLGIGFGGLLLIVAVVLYLMYSSDDARRY